MATVSVEGSVLDRCHVVPASYLSGLHIDVLVRRQDTTVEVVKLNQEYQTFLVREFPDFQSKFIQLPRVFAPKVKDSSKAIEGFVQKHVADIDKVWLSHTVGDQAESIVFYELEKQFLLRPALSWNGFQLGSVFKVAKEAVKEERTKRREQNLHVLDVPLSKIELDLYGLLGHDDTELTE